MNSSDNPYEEDPMAGMTRQEKQKLQSDLTIKDKFEQRLYGQILLSIPKHLCSLFLVLAFLSIIAIVILLLSDYELDKFMQSGQVLDFTKHKVHPLFGFQQKNTLNKESKDMLSARINNYTIETPKDLVPEDMKDVKDVIERRQNKFSNLFKNGGAFSNASKSYIPGHMDHINAVDMTAKMFYQNYLAVNKPVFVQEGCSEWPAMTKWSNHEYLAD